jgi:hypothetical protein
MTKIKYMVKIEWSVIDNKDKKKGHEYTQIFKTPSLNALIVYAFKKGLI